MTLQVQHPVVDWYLAFDDLWELLRVNWQTHNPFTQSGMWTAGEAQVLGIVLVVDQPPYRGVVLQVQDDEGDDNVAIVTYGPKCVECGYQPYNALWSRCDEDMSVITWGAGVISDLIANATMTGVERLHNDECSHLVYPDEEAEDDE